MRQRRLKPGIALACAVMLAGGAVPALSETETEGAPISEWRVESVVTHVNVGRHLDVAKDPITRETVVSYYDGVNGDLYLGMSFGTGPGNCGPGSQWHCVLLDSQGDVGQYNSIAIGGGGNWSEVWVSYYDATNAALKVARASYYRPTKDQFSFTLYTIDSGNPANNTFKGKHTSIALSPASIPHIAYQMSNPFPNVDEAQLYAHYVSSGGNCGEGAAAGKWQCDLIANDEGVGEYAAIDYELDPHATIAYFDRGRGYPVVAAYSGGGGNCGPANTWLCRSVENAGRVTGAYLSLYTEANGAPHLAYYNETEGTLEYATYVASGGNCGFSSGSLQWEWQCDWIDDMGSSTTSMGIDMEEDGAGYPIIAYQDATSAVGPAALRIARPYAAADWNPVPNCGPIDLFYTWVCGAVDTGGATLSEADHLALDLTPGGEALIAYLEIDSYPYPAEGSVKVAYEPLLVFEDGFESGNTGGWSASVPE